MYIMILISIVKGFLYEIRDINQKERKHFRSCIMLFSLLFIAVLLVCLSSASAFAPSRMNVAKASFMPLSANLVENVCKQRIVDDIKELRPHLTFKDINFVLQRFEDIITEEVLEKGKRVTLRHFGTFKRKTTKPRAGRNPKTGKIWHILCVFIIVSIVSFIYDSL